MPFAKGAKATPTYFRARSGALGFEGSGMPNMRSVFSWRELAENQGGETKRQFRDIKSYQQLLYWNTCCVSEGYWNMCAYYEIYFDHREESVFCVGTVFAKSVGTAYLSKNNLEFSIESIDDSENRKISLAAVTGAFAEKKFEAEIIFKIDIENKVWRILEAAIKLARSPSHLVPESKIIFSKTEVFNDSDHGREHESLCPNCIGEGQFVTFAIPKASRAKGLTGYGLYSENTVNAEHACRVCGGAGVKYRSWYIDENPDLKASCDDYREGKGVLALKRMSSLQSLANMRA